MLGRLVVLMLSAAPTCALSWTHGLPVTTAIGANRGQVATAVGSTAANTTSLREHFAHPDGAISNCRTIDVGWYIGAGLVPANTDAFTIKRYIEYPSGTFTQVTWSAATSVTVSPGTVVTSDVIPLNIPAGAEFYERTVNLTSTVSNFPLIELPAPSITLSVADGNSATDQGNSGTISPSAGTTTFGSVAIVCGVSARSPPRSFVIVGDSIAFGTLDSNNTDAKGNSGYVARTLGVHGYPYVKITKASQTAASFAGATTLPAALIAALSFTDVICEFGTNDLNGGASQATLLASLQTIYALFTGKRMYQTTIAPHSTSSNSWVDEAGQTPSTNGNLGNLSSVNDAIRVPQANVTAALDAADASMPTRNANIWTSPPTPTTDGLHPNSGETGRMATTLAPSL